MPAPILLNQETILPEAAGELVQWGKVYGCTAGLAVAELTQTRDQCVFVLTPTVAEAESLIHQVEFFLGAQDRASLYPDLEVLPYDAFSPHPDLIANRLKILRQLNDNRKFTVITAAAALLPSLPPPSYLRQHGISLKTGQQLEPGQFRDQLEDAGYQRVSQVSLPGDYAVRGSLMDFFPSGQDSPLRVDFFDDQVESLRIFDADLQTTTGKISAIDTLPAREIPIDEESVTAFRQRFRQRFDGNPAQSLIYREVTERRLPGGIENYLPLFFDTTASIWEYLPADTLVICCGDIETALNTAWTHADERYEQTRYDLERPALRPDELFFPVEHHFTQIDERAVLRLETFETPTEELTARSINLSVSAPPRMLINRREPETTRNLRDFLENRPARILFASESPGRREMLIEILQKEGLFSSQAMNWTEFSLGSSATTVSVAPLDKGVILRDSGIAIITEQELFGETPRRKRRHRRSQDPEALISDLTDLLPGAPVVHTDYGVGRYIGLTNLDIDETLTEFVTVEYADRDRLHVPVSSLHLISRYTGANAEHAPLHKLGSGQWAKARRKAAEKIRDVAAELLDLYSKRAARAGYRFEIDPVDAEKFADGFPFAETQDQQRAIEDVSNDLGASDPMDRLVCGDVGFGKTEVALRAAFTAVTNNRQVAVLVPTTLLAQQHYQTFVDRFADWPVNVEALSRFQSQKQSREILDGMRAGTVDIVIGTHRLLQRNVVFKNLGLAIIDEEHRFGVRHKEKLKALRTEVDILTLTATPIPRTLNMALGGLRELSLITSPPESRLSIKTFVTEWNERIIREACLREIKRGGQVYFVHNRVKDINNIADQVAELVPEGRIESAHGQMRERDLERIMSDFYHRRFHILVCTAIIESGLDVPSANTIIINRADRFGLAQLHQLRGRVGRSHHQAYAYLLAPTTMTADAAKRLETIEALEDLGAGFVLATHDLEIRGAGELLGEGQSGQIQEIGFSLYNEMLSRTVTAMREGLSPDLDFDNNQGPEINLHVAALFPADYLPDIHLRLVHYKRIASARNTDELQDLQIELIDRFGLLPDATRNLFRLTEIRLKAAPIGIQRLEMSATGGLIEFSPKTSVDPAILVHLLESEPGRFRLDRQQRLRVTDDLEQPQKRFRLAEQLVDQFSGTDNLLPSEISD